MKCKFCKEDMNSFFHCTLDTIKIEGELRPRIPYHKPYFGEEYDHCHDCGALDGFYHHPGCDMETCMNCGLQLISCPCEIDLKGVKIPPDVLQEVYERSTLRQMRQ